MADVLENAEGNIAKAESFVGRISKYVIKHERLLLVLVGVLALWLCGGKIQDIIAAHDQKVLDRDKATLAADIQKNAAAAEAYKQSAAQFQQLSQQYAQQNASLEATNASLVANLGKQQQTDRTLAPPQLAQRIATLANLAPADIQPAPGNTFTVTNPGAGQIAATLEELPVVKDELKNVTQERDNNAALLEKSKGNITQLEGVVTGLNKQMTDADKVCKDQVALVKAEARRSKRKWFIAGFITGFVSKIFLEKHP